MLCRIGLFASAMIVGTVPVVAQTSPPAKDVVVESTRLPVGKLPTETRTASPLGVVNQRLYENSQQIAKCAMRTSLPKLRIAIDGAPNSAAQRAAQAWLVRRTSACNVDPAIMAREEWDEGNVRGAADASIESGISGALTASNRSIGGSSVYDRGALIERMLQTYAPNLTLTEAETGDEVVQQRFNLREGLRNVDREPLDLEYFRVTVCMVKMQPRMAVKLYQAAPGSRDQGRAQALLINNARACVGNAKRVYVDSTQFRLYVLDALYRWVIAARDVSSLLPSDTASTR